MGWFIICMLKFLAACIFIDDSLTSDYMIGDALSKSFFFITEFQKKNVCIELKINLAIQPAGQPAGRPAGQIRVSDNISLSGCRVLHFFTECNIVAFRKY
jgi:hypothetical protein